VIIKHRARGLGGQALAQSLGIIAAGLRDHLDQLRQRKRIERQAGAEPGLQQGLLLGLVLGLLLPDRAAGTGGR